MELNISVQWAIGLALAVSRAGAFVGFCAFVPKMIPRMVRGIFALALGLFIATPVKIGADIATTELVIDAFVNISIGALIGWFLGLPVHLFSVAGSVVDTTSGITIGSLFDPDAGGTPGPISRAYSLTGQTLVIAMGGLTVMTQVLWVTTKVVRLDGRMGSIAGLSDVAIASVSDLVRHGVELALPIASVLFVGELAFGLLSRMAPQINMFLVGLPLKTLLTVSMLGSASVVFPRFVDRAISAGTQTALRLLGA